MSDDVQAWVAARAADVPPSLRQRMNEALVAGDPASRRAEIPDRLAAAAVACLRDVLPRCDERSGALDLLAADALITYACEAAVGDAPSLDSLCDAFAPDRLARVIGGRAPGRSDPETDA
jgi:hypothetical protein